MRNHLVGIPKREAMAHQGIRKRLKAYGIGFSVLILACAALRMTGSVESLAYWPSRDAFQTPVSYEDVWITTEDGVTLHGWFMPATAGDDGPKPAVLHLHGNAGNISHHASFSDYLPQHGIHTLIIDYRCYGRSDERGALRRDDLMLDANAALDFLLARKDVVAERVGVLGVSLGSAFGLALAAERSEVRAVASVGAFSSWQGVASDMIPVLGPMLMPGGLDQLDALEAFADRPYLIVHGDADEVIDHRHALLLKARCDELGVDATLNTAEGADHNGIMRTHAETRGVIGQFFEGSLGDPE